MKLTNPKLTRPIPSKLKFSPLKLLELAGFDRGELLTLASLNKEPEWNDKSNDETISKNTLVNLVPTAVTLSKDPSLALQLGQLNYVSHFGFFGFAIQSCSNLKQVLNLMLRYHPIVVSNDLKWEIKEIDDEVAVRFTTKLGNSDQKRLIAELAFSNFFATTKYLTGKTLTATELHLNHSKPDYYKSYRKYLPVSVKFNQPYNQILVPKAALDEQVKSANPASHVIFQQQCEEMLQDLNRIENTSAAVRRLLIQSAGDFPNIDHVAEQLHMSKSTLGRRLESESTSFRVITDEVKNLLAKEYLINTELTVADIAHLLDYTDTANFRRAFVRWNKITPSEFRESN